VVQADLSFLDLTSVAEAGGITLAVRPVGLMLAGTDPVALDTVAAHAIGYEDLPIWTTYYGNKIGLGCSDIGKIGIRGLDWELFEKRRLQYPFIRPVVKRSSYDRVSRAVNNTLLRPRPVVAASRCTGCSDCVQRCPVNCIEAAPNNVYRINLNSCVDCGCCVKVCDSAAVQIEFVGLSKTVRHLLGKQIAPVIEDAPV
jgi:ferredoxin